MEREGLLGKKVCLVTGTNRGIGKAIAEAFAKEGAIVYASARQDGCLKEWADKVNASVEGQILPVYFDITDSATVKQAVVQIKKDCGKLDVLVNNAGMVTNEVLGMISKDKLRDMFEVNVFGLLDLTQIIATRFMMKQKSGSIINMASIVGVEGSKGQISYSASKGAVVALTKSMAKELAPYQVRVNAIAPGMIGTDRLLATIENQYQNKIPPIGMERLGTPEDIAGTCVYLASDMSSYTTGQVVVVSGSMTP